jgi:hypothetical protein
MKFYLLTALAFAAPSVKVLSLNDPQSAVYDCKVRVYKNQGPQIVSFVAFFNNQNYNRVSMASEGDRTAKDEKIGNAQIVNNSDFEKISVRVDSLLYKDATDVYEFDPYFKVNDKPDIKNKIFVGKNVNGKGDSIKVGIELVCQKP